MAARIAAALNCMPLYFLNIKAISRAAGRSAPAAAAYRAGERIRDERTGVLHNYSYRRDVTHTEIFLPGALASDPSSWARQRGALWNAAEAAEHRRKSRVAREYQVTLPHELSAEQRLDLARRFSREIAERHQVAVDLAIHEPRSGGDPRNYHAHLLTTTREVSTAGLGAKTGLDMPPAERIKRALPSEPQEFLAIRERWAGLVNDSFRAAGLDERVDHRSLKAQGIDREPVPRIPYVALQIERRGVRSEVAESIRARYRERVAARAVAQVATPGDAVGLAPAPSNNVAAGLEELRRRSREAWLQLRSASLQGGSGSQAAGKTAQAARERPRDQSAESETPHPDKGLAL
jgi:hypothetical protein